MASVSCPSPSAITEDEMQPTFTSTDLFIHVMAFLRSNDRDLLDGYGRKTTIYREFHGVPRNVFEQVSNSELIKTINNCQRIFRMDYFGDAGLLVVTIPGCTHLMIAWELQHHIRQTLFAQGFFWRAWGPGIRNVYRTGPWKNEFTYEGADMSSLVSEGGLRINGVERPFLTIEVADKGGYTRARGRAIESLMGSSGNIRFAIIVDLVQNPGVNNPSVPSIESNCTIDLTGDEEPDEREGLGYRRIFHWPSNKRGVRNKLDGMTVIDLTGDEEIDVDVKNTNDEETEDKSEVNVTDTSDTSDDEETEVKSEVNVADTTDDEETNVNGREETGGEETNVDAKKDTGGEETNVDAKEDTGDEETNVHGKEVTGVEETNVVAMENTGDEDTNVDAKEVTSGDETNVHGKEVTGVEETNVDAMEDTGDEDTNVDGKEVTSGEGTDVNAKEDTGDADTNVNGREEIGGEETNVDAKEDTGDEATNVHGKEVTSGEGTDVNAKKDTDNKDTNVTNVKNEVIVIDISDDEETDAEFGNINMVPSASNVNKRAAEDDVDGSYVNTKRHAPWAGPPSPSTSVEVNSPSSQFRRDPAVSSTIIPSAGGNHTYASITVTVLTTRLVQHPNASGKKQRICVTLIDKAECWPARPGPDVIFRFTWEDMNTKSYPAELQGRLFSINFDWLHDLIRMDFTGDCQIPDMDSDDENEVEPRYDNLIGKFPIPVDHENPVDIGRTKSEDHGSEPHGSENPFADEDIIHDGYPPENSNNQFPGVDKSRVRDDTFRSRLPVIEEQDEHMAEVEMMIDSAEKFVDHMTGLVGCGGFHSDASREL